MQVEIGGDRFNHFSLAGFYKRMNESPHFVALANISADIYMHISWPILLDRKSHYPLNKYHKKNSFTQTICHC